MNTIVTISKSGEYRWKNDGKEYGINSKGKGCTKMMINTIVAVKTIIQLFGEKQDYYEVVSLRDESKFNKMYTSKEYAENIEWAKDNVKFETV